MPAVDPVKLKRLLTLEVLLPFALDRKLSATQLEDLAQRAMPTSASLSARCPMSSPAT